MLNRTHSVVRSIHLRGYDADTAHQPPGLFQCHQQDTDGAYRRVCAGWAGCHDGDELLALRLALLQGRISEETFRAVVSYSSPVPLFESGDDAADHGQRQIDTPDELAVRTIAKIVRVRGDLR
jgi:hypothetical protein